MFMCYPTVGYGGMQQPMYAQPVYHPQSWGYAPSGGYVPPAPRVVSVSKKNGGVKEKPVSWEMRDGLPVGKITARKDADIKVPEGYALYKKGSDGQWSPVAPAAPAA